jgi:hypothetical protein
VSATTTATPDTFDLDYQIGVMQAFKAGKKIDFRLRNSTASVWSDDEVPLWNWAVTEYRVKPDPMDLLTELVERWSAESRQLHEKADTRKQQYGTNNSVFVSLDAQSRTLGTCCSELLERIRQVKEASK